MTSQNDTKEDHGSQEPPRPPGRDGPAAGGRSGHGSDSALAQVISQHKQRQQGGEPEDAAGARGQ